MLYVYIHIDWMCTRSSRFSVVAVVAAVACGKIVILFRKSTNLFNWTWISTHAHIHTKRCECVWLFISSKFSINDNDQRRSVGVIVAMFFISTVCACTKIYYDYDDYFCCCFILCSFAVADFFSPFCFTVGSSHSNEQRVESLFLSLYCVSVALYEYASILSQSHS